MPLATNHARFLLEIEGCDDELQVVGFTLDEAISTPFELEVELASPNRELDLGAQIRRPALLTILGVHDDAAPRHVHGIVHSISQGRQDEHAALYRVRIVPQVWTLRYRQDSRIFQAMSTQEIVREVLRGAGIPADALRFSLAGDLPRREYCVQYRESDWDFVSRLLEEDGCWYFFAHEAGAHTLVIGDAPSAHPAIAGEREVLFNDVAAASSAEAIHEFRYSEHLGPGKVTARDFNFTAPDSKPEGQSAGGRASDLEIYDYPGRFADAGHARRAARLGLQSLQASQKLGEGESDCPRLAPGHTFALHEPAGALRPGLLQDYLVVAARHRGKQPQSLGAHGAGGDSSYRNEFTCIPAAVPYRPPQRTPRPEVRGVQTAIVVGPGGEEIHVDEHGRVKVQFHWDRQGKHDDHSSCWIRVSQLWAGQNFGAMWIPRVGHEVIVDFLEGDPDRPIITGRVYHGNNQPPYPLPDEKTKSTIKSESSPGGGGSNELRFEDAKGREEVYLHGQKDWTIVIENDKNQRVGHDEALSVGHDSSEDIGNNRSESVGADKQVRVGGNHTEAIGGDMSISVGGNLGESVAGSAGFTIGGSKSESVAVASVESIGAAKALSVGAAYQVSVGGAMNESVGLASMQEVGLAKMVVVGQDSGETVGGTKSVTAAENISQSAGQNAMLAAGKNANLSAGKNMNLSAGKNLGVVAADKLTISCGDVTVTIKKNGDISVQGKKLSIKTSGDVTVKAAKIKLN